MGEFYIKYFEDGVRVSSYHCADELKVIEKGIELFKAAGGKVRYKVPERGEKLISNTTGELLEADDIYNPSGSDRLTFTPPKPEPVAGEWEKLRESVSSHSFIAFREVTKIIMDKIDELERCLKGGGK